PQTFRMSTLSLASVTFHGVHCNVVPLKVNRAERWSSPTRSMLPSPEMNPLPSPDLACAAMELASELQAATPRHSAPAATASVSFGNVCWKIYRKNHTHRNNS